MIIEKSITEPYHASKWLSIALLVDADEMKSLFESLGHFFIYSVGSVVKKGTGEVSKKNFLEVYAKYIECLKNGEIPEDTSFRSLFSSALTQNEDHVYALTVGNDQQIIRIAKPVIQMQTHTLDYSQADGKFRSMVLGKDSILWGIQFSYPQLYEEPKTHAVHKVNDSFPNTALFRSIQKWVRQHTVPTPFIVDEKTVNVPMRLGKKCFSWINQHSQLAKKKLKISV